MQNKNIIFSIVIGILYFFVGVVLYNTWDNLTQIKNQKNHITELETKFSMLERSYQQKNKSLCDSLTSLKSQNYLLAKKLNDLEIVLAGEVKNRKIISKKLAEISQQKTVKAPVREKIAKLQKKIEVLNKMISAAEKLARIQNNIRGLQIIQYYAPTDEEIYQLLLNEYKLSLNSNDWSRLDPVLNQLATFLKKNPRFTDLNKYSYDPQLKALLEKKGIEFRFKFTSEIEYFGYLLHLFQADNNQVRKGHYADIMAGLYKKPAIRAKYEKKLKQISCPGGGSLYEYLEKIQTNGDSAPVPNNVTLQF